MDELTKGNRFSCAAPTRPSPLRTQKRAQSGTIHCSLRRDLGHQCADLDAPQDGVEAFVVVVAVTRREVGRALFALD